MLLTKYATAEDFVQRVGLRQAIDLTAEYGDKLDEEVLELALYDSSSQIDGYLSGRYSLPLEVIPHNLTRLCCDLARYRLASMRSTTITEEVIERYKFSLRELEAIALGKITLGIEQNRTPSVMNGDTVSFESENKRVFKR